MSNLLGLDNHTRPESFGGFAVYGETDSESGHSQRVSSFWLELCTKPHENENEKINVRNEKEKRLIETEEMENQTHGGWLSRRFFAFPFFDFFDCTETWSNQC
jgi:hypothetical protein